MSFTYTVSRVGFDDVLVVPADFTDRGGLAVQESALAGACTLNLNPAVKPLGLAHIAEPGGRVSVVAFGVSEAVVGAAGIIAGTQMLQVDGAGAVVAFAPPGAGIQRWSIGDMVATELAGAAPGAGAMIKVFVNPRLVTG